MTVSDRHLRDKVVDDALNAALDPALFDELEVSWEKFLDHVSSPDDNVQQNRMNTSITRAIEILQRLEASSQKNKNAHDIVNSNPGIGFISDKSFRIVSYNEDADFIFSSRAELVYKQELSAVEKWIKSNASNKSAEFFFSSVYLDREYPITLLVTKIFLQHDPQIYFFVTELDILLNDRALDQIMSAFGLTRAESEVCLLLSNGFKPIEIARRRNVSIHTVRVQIKSAIEKSGAKSSTDLVRSLCGLAARLNYLGLKLGKENLSLTENKFVSVNKLTLRDGRVLEFIDQGDPNGRPVIYLHSYLDAPRLQDWKVERFFENQWRVIAPSKPGYGKSTDIAQGLPNQRLQSFSDDLMELLAHLRLKKVIVVGQHYAIDFATRYPNSVRGLLLHNGVPVWDSKFQDKMTRRRRNLAKTFRKWPGSLKLLVGLSVSLINSGRADIFLRGLARGSKRNTELLSNPEFLAHAIYECRHNVEQGADAFLADIKVAHLNMQNELVSLKLPVAITQYENGSHIPREAVAYVEELVPNALVFGVGGNGAESYIEMNFKLIEALEYLYDKSRK